MYMYDVIVVGLIAVALVLFRGLLMNPSMIIEP